MVASRFGVFRSQLPDDAEDLIQETIIRAMNGLPRFEMRSDGAFAAWLATIAENAMRNHVRSRNSPGERRLWQRYGDIDLSESFFPGAEPSPSRLMAGVESNRAIEAAMLGLPMLHRQVLSLRFFACMSHAEIAQQIGHTEQNCRKLVQRALEALRAELAKAQGR